MIYEYKETLLKVDGVNLSYDGRPILRDVHAEIKRIEIPGRKTGQIVGFLGPSGVGKTQLFRIIAGLHKPDSGQVLLMDEFFKSYYPVEAGDVGVVAQNYPLFNHRTIISNLMLPLLKHNSAKTAENEVKLQLENFCLTDQTHLYPAQLSGGQRQRVAILQMILSGSRFILMDEPFSGLDMIMLEKTCQTIADMSDHGGNKTIIIVTHDITSAASISDHIWLLGHERDAQGNAIPGARVVETYDLLERGLCYTPGIITTPEFGATVREIKERFRTL